MLYDQLVAAAVSLLLWPPFFPVVGVPTTAVAALIVVRGSRRFRAGGHWRALTGTVWAWVAWMLLAWEGFVLLNILGVGLVERDSGLLAMLGWFTLWHGAQTTLVVWSLVRVRRTRRSRFADLGDQTATASCRRSCG